MEVIENKEFIPSIETEEIRFLQCDYELHLKDLGNYRVEYDKATRKIYIIFDTIYVYDIEKLTALNMITGSFKNYTLNGFYEKDDYKAHNITIGQDIIDYLFNWEKDYLERSDK